MNTCAWCNKSVDDHKTIWIRKNLLIGYPFCSNKCASQWKDNKSAESKKANQINSFENASIEEDRVIDKPSSKSFDDVLAEARIVNAQQQIKRDKQTEIDKSNKEFFDSLKKNWKIVVVGIIILVISIKVFSHFNDISKQNDANLSQELEQIEDQVKLSIQSGDKQKALDLTNKLIHPSHNDMESQKFDTWHGYPKYDEYWNKKREKYKEQIIKLQ